MTKDKALYKYFNNFMPSYPSSAVPDDTTFPWLTYEVITGAFGDEPVGITVNLWYRTESESIPNEQAQALRQYIALNNIIKCDEGYIWVKPGSPWCQNLTDEVDASIKRRYINITLEYLTFN